jgi:hypothetical protein
VLVFPLEDTPIGRRLAPTCICDLADEVKRNAAKPRKAAKAQAHRREILLIVTSAEVEQEVKLLRPEALGKSKTSAQERSSSIRRLTALGRVLSTVGRIKFARYRPSAVTPGAQRRPPLGFSLPRYLPLASTAAPDQISRASNRTPGTKHDKT